jgi:hypothetical protein
VLQKRLNRSCAVKAPGQGWGWDQVKCQSTEQLYSSRASLPADLRSDLVFRAWAACRSGVRALDGCRVAD